MPITIIYHDNCPDGWGAAWWLERQIRAEYAQTGAATPAIKKIPGRYGEAPNLARCMKATVFLVDFCYPAAQLNQIAQVADIVTVLDHHQTAVEYVDGSVFTRYDKVDEWADDPNPGLQVAVIDQTRSGIGIVGEYCEHHGADPIPAWMEMIEDRDLWKFEFGELTHEVFAAVTSRPYTEEAWEEINALGSEGLRAEGRGIVRYRNQLIDQIAASHFLLDLQDEDGNWMQVPCVSSPYAVGSDTAGRLAEEHNGVGAYAILHSNDVQIGLRSRKDGPDVAKIAERYGGGGHRNASGLRLAWDDFFEAIGA